MVWDKDHLAWWERAKRETLAGVALRFYCGVAEGNTPSRRRRR